VRDTSVTAILSRDRFALPSRRAGSRQRLGVRLDAELVVFFTEERRWSSSPRCLALPLQVGYFATT
jgi:hypothetical protein